VIARAETVRIGVVADSHVGETLPELPARVLELLAGVDLILHAGDLTDLAVVRRLEEIAPVHAVQGDHDLDGGIALPRSLVVRVGDYRIGVTHGRRPRAVEIPAAGASLALRRPVLLGFHRSMRRRLGRVDCVVYGHLHIPHREWRGGVLYFSPGAVLVPERDDGYDRNRLRARAYLRFRESLPPEIRRPSVGILEVGPSGLSAHVLPLDEPPPDPGDGSGQEQ
jgi:uncharacterized protein